MAIKKLSGFIKRNSPCQNILGPGIISPSHVAPR